MQNRRTFIKASGLFLASTALASPSFLIPKRKEKLGVALVGLGHYSTDLLAPALQLTKYCELKGIVTGSPEKIPVWQQRYGIKSSNVYSYDTMHEMANNSEIDVVYIVLPNSLHKKYAVIAAEAGKHVWCEKPMALTASECQAMINACDKNKVQLTVGYRMQHEPNTQTIINWATAKPYGSIKNVATEAGFIVPSNSKNHWRLNKDMGGGAMYDMGVYCLNAARYVTGLEPVSVSATQSTKRPDLFSEVDETMQFTLQFPQGITATCKTSFGETLNTLKVDCEKGWYRLKPFQSYTGVRGFTSSRARLNPFSGNQQAKQMDNDTKAIVYYQEPIVKGLEGLKDVRIIEAIYKSAAAKGSLINL